MNRQTAPLRAVPGPAVPAVKPRPRAAKRRQPAPTPVEHALTHAALAEYLPNGAVYELVVVQFERGAYRIEATLSWRAGKSVLVAARGAVRTFRSLDTVARFLESIGIGATVVRLELNR